MEAKPRQHYIDWLRLIAVFLLFTFHTARIFDPWENFYVQNNQPSQGLFNVFIWAVGPWHMTLFFLLAGASTYFALQHRRGSQYALERLKRLLIPFIFGVLVIIPPQSYLGVLSHSGQSIPFFKWFPQFFALQGDDPDGYFLGGHTWGHLWFIVHLFIYSLAALPLFLFFNRESGQMLIKRLAAIFKHPAGFFLPPLVIMIASADPEIAGGNPLFYITFFIFGFILMSDAGFMETVDKRRITALVLGPVIFALVLALSWLQAWPAGLPAWFGGIVDGYMECIGPWFIILCMLSYGRRFLNFTNRFLKYFAEGAYALYILHQTVIVIVGFYVVQWELAVLVKFLIISVVSFVTSVLVYDLAVRRTKVTRFLFGMRV